MSEEPRVGQQYIVHEFWTRGGNSLEKSIERAKEEVDGQREVAFVVEVKAVVRRTRSWDVETE